MIGNKVEITEYNNKEIFEMTIQAETNKELEMMLKMHSAYYLLHKDDSTLCLVELIDITMDKECRELLTRYLPISEIYNRKTAVIPGDTLLRAFILDCNKNRTKKFVIFQDIEEALKWLTEPNDNDDYSKII